MQLGHQDTDDEPFEKVPKPKLNQKMKKNILFLIFGILLIGSVAAVGEISFCCEKTTGGAWCQNAPESECNTDYRKVPTSCEATFFCQQGCCFDSQEGRCWPNTAQVTCEERGGIYSASASCDVPQCDYGCCVLGDQAAYVTQTRCKYLSALQNLETNFRTDITNEVQCILSVSSEDMGACVIEKNYQRDCEMLTQRECQKLKESSSDSNIEFHSGYLCSAEELGTNCGMSKQTTCVEDKDEVYFIDTCGNIANIYDYDMINNKEYWTYLKSKQASCDYSESIGGDSNAGDSNCGNCDYFMGSTCKKYDRGKDDVKPSTGDFICRDLGCKDSDFKAQYNRDPQHGETWCVTNSEKLDLPGSEYFRFLCYNGEVTVEPCAAFRQEICISSEIVDTANNAKFLSAGCRVNRWETCFAQDNPKDCLNYDQRDCKWIKNGNTNSSGGEDYSCVPTNPPGFQFWGQEEETIETTCGFGSYECTAKFEKRWFDSVTGKGEWKCVENCWCCYNDDQHTGCENDWDEDRMNYCEALGDCGAKPNYIGKAGYNSDENPITIA